MRRLILIYIFLFLNTNIGAEQFIYKPQDRRDIMFPLVDDSGNIINFRENIALAEINLEAIIYNPEGKSLAIINGEVYKENDLLGEYRIVKIYKKKVVFEDEDGKKIELILGEEVIK